MNSTIAEVLEFVSENDIRFVRLAFCDIFGQQKNLDIMADELAAAFEFGVSFDAHAIRGFMEVTDSDLLLFPDAETLSVLPWRAAPARVARFFCTIKHPDGSLFMYDGRTLLKRVEARADNMGYTCKVGVECEFYLFKTDENGEPTQIPFDKGGYLDMSPLDKCENIRREICLTLSQMNIVPEASHHEQGFGQNEIDFRFGNAVESADNLMTFKTVVKAVAERNGLFASFMPKPLPKSAGNGLHVNLSLSKNGRNIFRSASSGEHSEVATSFIAGVLQRAREISLFLNPTANSYQRLGRMEAPRFVSWSHHNRSQLIRIPAASGEKVRMELRSPDPSTNPYLAFALIISAGLEGIEQQLVLPPPVNVDVINTPMGASTELSSIPCSLEEAIELARKSVFAKQVLGGEIFEKFIKLKLAEAAAFKEAEDKDEFCKREYFAIL